MYLQESNQGKTAPRTALRCHEGKALPGCLWHFSTIFYSIKKSILKIAVPPNLKFCFLEISWRKTTINYRIMWEEMTSSTAINFLWMKSFGVREGFGPGLADGSWLLSVLVCPRKTSKTIQSTEDEKILVTNVLQSYKGLRDKVGKTFCVSTLNYTLGNGPLGKKGSDGQAGPRFTHLHSAGKVLQGRSAGIS